MSEETELSTGLLVAIVVTVPLVLLLLGCLTYGRCWSCGNGRRSDLDSESVATSCATAMTSLVCCGVACLAVTGKGATDATVNGAAAARTAAESGPYEWLMCRWLEWLVHNVLCCCFCCRGPRDCSFTFATTAESTPNVPVAQPVAVSVSPAQAEQPVAVAVPLAPAKPSQQQPPPSSQPQPSSQPPSSTEQAESASVTTPLLALAV